MFTFNTISTISNFIIEFFNDNLQSKKRREFLFNDFVVKSFRKFVFENLQFDNQKQTFVNFESQLNTRKTIVEKIIYRQLLKFQLIMFFNINFVVQIVIDKFIKTMFQRFKNLINKQYLLLTIEFVFNANVNNNQFTIKFSFKKLNFLIINITKKQQQKTNLSKTRLKKQFIKIYIFLLIVFEISLKHSKIKVSKIIFFVV